MKTSLSKPPLHSHGRALAKVEGLNTTLSCDSGARVIRRIEANPSPNNTQPLTSVKESIIATCGLVWPTISTVGSVLRRLKSFILVVIHFRSQFYQEEKLYCFLA